MVYCKSVYVSDPLNLVITVTFLYSAKYTMHYLYFLLEPEYACRELRSVIVRMKRNSVTLMNNKFVLLYILQGLCPFWHYISVL